MNFLRTLKEINLSFSSNLSSFDAKTNKKELETISDELFKIHVEKDPEKQAETWALVGAKLSQALSVLKRLESAVSDTDENTRKLVEFLKNRTYDAWHAVSYTEYNIHKHESAKYILRGAIWSLNLCCHDSLIFFDDCVKQLEKDSE